MPTNPAPEPIDRLRLSIARLSRVLRGVSPTTGVTRAQESALRVINRRGPLSTAHLADLEQMRPQSMGQIVRDVVDLGLVDKAADPTDGRRELLSLTDQGRSVLGEVCGRRDAALAALLAERLDPAERAALFGVLPILERLGEER